MRTRIATALAASALAAGGTAAVSGAQAPEHGAHGQAQSAQAATTPAADLRAALTAGLQEHSYLAGIAVDTGVRDGLRSRSYRAAAEELDENSQAVAALVGEIYGEAPERRFLALWRRHIRLYVVYTTARLEDDRRAERRAERGLADFVEDMTRLLTQANPNLDAEVVQRELTTHGGLTLRVIDATVARSPRAYARLQANAAHMVMTADLLATAIAAQFPDRFPA